MVRVKGSLEKIFVVVMLFLVVFVGSMTNVNAEGVLKEDFTTFEIPTSFSYESTNGRSAFFNGGMVFSAKARGNANTLYYYDANGELLNEKELPDVSVIYYMKENGGYLYVIVLEENGYYLYKLDKKLDVLGKICFVSDGYVVVVKYDLLFFDSSRGVDLLCFTDENIILYFERSIESVTGIYSIDYKLKEVKTVPYEKYSEYLNNYFPTLMLGSPRYEDRFSTVTKNGKTDIYSFSDSLVGTIYADHYVGGETVRKEIKNENYKNFSRTKVVGDYIVTVGGKEKDFITSGYGADKKIEDNIASYVSDVVVYNLEGEHVETIPVDKTVNYLNVSDDSISISTQVYDGVCTEDKYSNSDVGCDVLSSVSNYYFTEYRKVDDNKNTNGVSQIKNPQTASTIVFVASIICFVICLLGTVIISIKKQKMI